MTPQELMRRARARLVGHERQAVPKRQRRSTYEDGPMVYLAQQIVKAMQMAGFPVIFKETEPDEWSVEFYHPAGAEGRDWRQALQFSREVIERKYDVKMMQAGRYMKLQRLPKARTRFRRLNHDGTYTWLKVSKDFELREFACKCGQCYQVPPDRKLVRRLQDARQNFGAPITIHSGHRCAPYNLKVGGASGSLHLTAKAADHTVRGVSPPEVADWWDAQDGVGGLGRYGTFTHVDFREGKARWSG